MTARDLDVVAALEPELFGAGAWSRGTYEDQIERTDRVYLVAELDGEVAGYAGVALEPEWDVMTVGVAPQARRRGVATALVEALVDAARSAGGRELFLEVRAHDGGAQQLYRNAGFAPVGLRRRYYQPEGADAVVMRLALDTTDAGPVGPVGAEAVDDGSVEGDGSAVGPFVDVATAYAWVWSEHAPVVLDVRWTLGRTDGREQYAQGHLPGAVFVDLDTELAGPASPEAGRHPLPDLDVLQAAARRWGVRGDSRVLVYDDAGGTSAARAWWLLRWAGVRDVVLLDGGLRAWVEAGHHLEDGHVRPRPGDVTLTSGAMPTVAADDIAVLPERGGVLLDARAAERFRGEVEPVDPRPGHIPGATSAPTLANLTAGGWLLEAEELRERFAALGVDVPAAGAPEPGSRPVAVYCGSGVTASHTVAVLASLGVTAALYPGSFSQWSSDPTRPVATGL